MTVYSTNQVDLWFDISDFVEVGETLTHFKNIKLKRPMLMIHVEKPYEKDEYYFEYMV